MADALWTAQQWLDRFDGDWAAVRPAATTLSLSADSWDHYPLAYYVDAATAAWRAGGPTRYLTDALTLVENVVATARPSANLGAEAFQDSYRGWRSQRSDVAGEEVPLFESYLWRYAAHLLLVAQTSPTAMADQAIATRVTALVAFLEQHIFDKWYARGPNGTIYRSRTHMASHWAFIAMCLHQLTTNTTRRARCQEILRASREGGTGEQHSLTAQFIPSTQVSGALFWSDEWGVFARPGQDIAHGNNLLAYIVEAHDRGETGWPRATIDGICKALTAIAWPNRGTGAASPVSEFIDGTGTGTGWLSDGFVKLGRHDAALQARLQNHDVANYQFLANGALNAAILTRTTTPTPGGTMASAYDTAALADGPSLLVSADGAAAMRDRAGSHTVALTGSPTSVTAPDGSPALRLDGTSQYLTIGDAADLSVSTTGRLTIEVLLRPDVLEAMPATETSGEGPIVYPLVKGTTFGAAGDQEYALRLYDRASERPNRFSGYVFNPAGGLGAGSYFQDALVAGRWVHVAVVVDTVTKGADGWGTVRIYRDGVLRDTDSLGDPYFITPENKASPLYLGARPGKSYFPGAVAKLAVFPTAVSPARIRAHADAALTAEAVVTPTPTPTPGGTMAGTPFRTGGANIFHLAVNDYGGNHIMSHAEIDELLDKCKPLNIGLVRAHTLGVSIGNNAYSLVTGVSGTGTNPTIAYNDAVWEAIDYAVAGAAKRGIYLMVPMTDELGYYHGGRRTWVNFRRPGTCSSDFNVKASNSTAERAAEGYFYTDTQIVNDFKKYISDWLNHVNQYTGRANKDEPAIAIIELGNELWTAAQDAPTWSPAIAAHIKAVAPAVLVADGSATDGQVLVSAHLNSREIDIHGTHPYSTFGAYEVTQMARQAAAGGKAFLVGEYPWSKAAAPGIEAASRAEPNVFSTAFWSLQRDADLHNGGGPDKYGTDDASFYAPGKTQVERTANARIRDHGAGMASTIPGAAAPITSYDDAFTGDGALETGRWIVSASTGSSALRVGGRAVLTTGRQGQYYDRAIVESRAPQAADPSVSLVVTPGSVDEAYFTVLLRAKSGGPTMNAADAYGVEISAQGSLSVFKQAAGAKTVLRPGVAIAGWAPNAPVKLEWSVVGTTYTARAWTGATRPASPTATGSDATITGAGGMGVILNGGSAAAARTWSIDDWKVA